MVLARPVATEQSLGGYVVAVCPTPRGVTFVTAEGKVAHEGASAAAVQDAAVLLACSAPGGGVLTGAEDGVVRRIAPDGSVTPLISTGRWIDALAVSPASGLVAAASGKAVTVVDCRGGQGHSFAHGSTVTGLAFDEKGKRLAASHYNGASLWWAGNPASSAALLNWKGSHIGITLSPDGRFIVTAMQEAALHGWRLADKVDMRMAGYPAKTRSMAWTVKGRWLATSGAQAVVCWPFQTRDGPMGKPPMELSAGGALVTVVAAHPRGDIVAAGYEDGSVFMFRLEDAGLLPVANAGGAPVTALAFSGDGDALGFGCEDGRAGIVRLAR